MQDGFKDEQKRITILIADDHKLFRETCSMLFDKDLRFRIVGQASNGKEVIQLSEELCPDIILMDINMEPVNGFDAVEAILKIKSDSKIIAVSMNDNPAIIKKMVESGVRGYVSKNSSLEEFTEAILSVNSGSKYRCNETKELLAKTIVKEDVPSLPLLSRREIAVIQHIKQGLSSREIGIELGISFKTVEVHRYNILKKMKLRNTAALVHFCASTGI